MSSDAIFRLGSESAQTYRLKWAAWQWLYQAAGCRCLGFEVRLQGPWGAVIDVVGVGPGNLIYAVEVKSSRGDFARDNHTAADVARLRRQFDSLARRMELASAPAYQDAGAAGSSDLERLRREWERLRARLATISTKFHDPRFLAIADYHYIMAPAGVVRAERLPPAWGLLAPASDTAAPAPHPDSITAPGNITPAGNIAAPVSFAASSNRGTRQNHPQRRQHYGECAARHRPRQRRRDDARPRRALGRGWHRVPPARQLARVDNLPVIPARLPVIPARLPAIPARLPAIPARLPNIPVTRHPGASRNLALVPPFSSVSANEFAPESSAETTPSSYSIAPFGICPHALGCPSASAQCEKPPPTPAG